ncbi:hypothetical protein HMPREF0083_02373 [Aneurinibacillus aneurinilyticus ATCC 12856]|uniref:Uncharacterized protein n=1 Tax=Aneurinibacillus aneurinilyticus ATCC 12856 TaxID=649747 RepID=U1YBP8_ANEAE|nr:hypothetical protein HMPREF0083_02373 [Aneurinibacillus aneurinilyticus ATCC 12856]
MTIHSGSYWIINTLDKPKCVDLSNQMYIDCTEYRPIRNHKSGAERRMNIEQAI